MQPSRSTQPYRQGQPRQPGDVLYNMLSGRDLYGQNPQDPVRLSQRRARGSVLRGMLGR
jgi:hypothetical protein